MDTCLWVRTAYRVHPAQQPEPFQAAQMLKGIVQVLLEC